jgi:hypothetical protein
MLASSAEKAKKENYNRYGLELTNLKTNEKPA